MERKDNILKVQGLDAVDGSPILDIKPFTLSYPNYEKVTVPPMAGRFDGRLEKGRIAIRPEYATRLRAGLIPRALGISGDFRGQDTDFNCLH